MSIAIIGTGFIGGILGSALVRSGHDVVFGSRHPEDDAVAPLPSAEIVSIATALDRADVAVLAVPGASVAELAREHGEALQDKLVIDATNQMGQPVANSRAALPATVRYARAFNTVGGENLADPQFSDGLADMFFSAPETDRAAVEDVIVGVGLRPIYVGVDKESLVDSVFQLWIALAMQQKRGRRMAFRLLED